MILNLLVLRTADIDRLGLFYEALGMAFVRERHGRGPEHLASSHQGATFEIYPCTGDTDTRGTRIGFQVKNVAEQFDRALAVGGEPVSRPQTSEWGARAVVRDPAGHIVEFLEPAREIAA
jgi:catechol 2,3-dioxygenase-like lactoylglutathione lyase family enzyme